jgi:'Cold-shock' DNA-binding domain
MVVEAHASQRGPHDAELERRSLKHRGRSAVQRRARVELLCCGGHHRPPLCPSETKMSPRKREELRLTGRTTNYNGIRLADSEFRATTSRTRPHCPYPTSSTPGISLDCGGWRAWLRGWLSAYRGCCYGSQIRSGDSPDMAVPAVVAFAQQSPRSHHYQRGRKRKWLPVTVKWFSDEKGFGFITPDDQSKGLVRPSQRDRRSRLSLARRRRQRSATTPSSATRDLRPRTSSWLCSLLGLPAVRPCRP